jgi:hypothetical protein
LSGDAAYREFEEALTDVLCAEKFFLAQRSRLEKARAAINDSDPRYWLALRQAHAHRLVRHVPSSLSADDNAAAKWRNS